MGLLWGVIALGVVIVGLWLWLNVRLLRGGNHSDDDVAIQPTPPVAYVNDDGAPGSSGDASDAAIQQPAHPEGGAEPGERTNLNQGTEQAANAVGAATREREPVDEPKDVEVLPDFSRGEDRKVFGKAKLPFVIHRQAVPQFASEFWVKSFMRLNQDARVLGWIAFDDAKVGASDHDYDSGLIQVLRTYRNTVEKLRQEVGLSHVMEASVAGDEGKVWLFAGADEVWFALFLEKQVDVHDIVDQVLLPVGGRSPETE